MSLQAASAPPAAAATAAVWQWYTEFPSREKPVISRAFLWISPDCRRVRAVVVAQNNMEEESILENPRFRDGLARLGFAEVWVSPPFDHLFRFDRGAGDTFETMMTDLAAVSGYGELAYAPVVPMGHSAAASWPYYLAAWKPNRVLAALSISGQWPYFRDPVFAPDIWGERTLDYVPCLESMGEYESAETWANEGLKERAQRPLLPLSMIANPGQGHFASTDDKADYLALYLRKAAQYRLPQDTDKGDSAPLLRPVDPTRTGWLVERWHRDRPASAPAAPVGRYLGDPSQAFWFFDEEMAQATEAYEARYRGLKPQLAGFVQDGAMVSQHSEHLQINLKFAPDPDGITFHLGAAFYDAVPGGSPRPASWTGLPVGSPVGHATGGGPIRIERITGPFEQIGPDTFRLQMRKETTGQEPRWELVLAAVHPGDGEYRPAVQQAHLFVPARNREGKPQHIIFPALPDQKAGTRSLPLRASSDSGERVRFTVIAGPAEIIEGADSGGDTLRFTPVPPRAKYPLKITVMAWQWGRNIPPLLQTAEPVTREFYLRAQ